MVPIYVINLAGSQERLARAEQQLHAQQLDFERIEAVNGKTLTAEQVSAVYSEADNRRHFYRPLSAGEIGCYLSHRRCWQTLIQSGAEYAVILEDDFTLCGDLADSISAIINTNMAIDIVKLCSYQGRERPVKYSTQISGEQHLVVHDKPMSGCCAYVISRQGAKQLLAHSTKISRPVDTDIQYCWETGVDVVSIKPYPVAQDNFFDSDIAAKGRNKPKPYPLQKQWLALTTLPAQIMARKNLIKNLKSHAQHLDSRSH